MSAFDVPVSELPALLKREEEFNFIKVHKKNAKKKKNPTVSEVPALLEREEEFISSRFTQNL
jgi:hypothetical protein